MPSSRSPDSARALHALRRLVRALRAATHTAERAHAVSTAQLFVLRELSASPGMSLNELPGRTHTTQSTVSEVVARLVDGGLVQRRTSPDDGRRHELSLTARGRTLVARAAPSMSERLLAALDAMPAAQRRSLADGLDAWLTAAGLADAPAPMFFERPANATTKVRRAR